MVQAVHNIIEENFRSSYRSWVKRVYCRVKKNEDAEDIVMEAYTRALKYQHTFIQGNNFEYWFSRIIANAVKDWKREQHNQFEHQEEFDEQEMAPCPDPSIKRDLYATLSAEIDELEKPERAEIVHLYFILGFKPRDIMKITNQKSVIVNNTIQHFKGKMKGKYME